MKNRNIPHNPVVSEKMQYSSQPYDDEKLKIPYIPLIIKKTAISLTTLMITDKWNNPHPPIP